MRTVDEVVSDIKSILNNIERTEECYGETLVDIDELCDEILTISCRPQNTNADRIRAMSDEELAEFFAKFTTICEMCVHYDENCITMADARCKQGILHWLKSEAKE